MSTSLPLRPALIVLLGAAIHLQVFAQHAALPPTATPNTDAAGTEPAPPAPGRLFYSAERRQALDQQRKTLQFRETIVEGDTLTLNGIVTRSSGKWTLFINGNPITERDGPSIGAAPVAGRSGRSRLSGTDDGASSRVVAVGEGLERTTGTVNSSLGTGTIRVHSRPGSR